MANGHKHIRIHFEDDHEFEISQDEWTHIRNVNQFCDTNAYAKLDFDFLTIIVMASMALFDLRHLRSRTQSLEIMSPRHFSNAMSDT